MKFIALLRGVNVGGKNKVAMPELKACFEGAGFDDVRTYINSGNVVFESTQLDTAKLVAICENAIRMQCGFDVVCAVISADELVESLRHAPAWWGEGDGKHNAIFAIAPKKAEEIMAEIGDTKPEYEKVAAYHPIIFWSAPIETFSRTRYSKIVGTKLYQSVTIRNLSTTKKIADMCREV
jgi:uncharacterized protein (DUF1697 family)